MKWTISKHGTLVSDGVAFANPTSSSKEVKEKMLLAAAAPDLLTMLESIVKEQDEMGFDGSPSDDLLGKARVAIAKAKGV